MKPQHSILYFVHSAELLSDGVLRIDTAGIDGNSLWDGFQDIAPDSPDYDFWLWLTRRLKQPKLSFRAIKPLDEQEIAKYRDEFMRERA